MRSNNGGASTTVTENHPDGDTPQELHHKPPSSHRDGDVDMADETFRLPSAQEEYGKAPTLADENPHLQWSQRGARPERFPAPSCTPYTDAIFPRIVIPLDDLLTNLATELVAGIEENPGDFLAVVPFGAGNKFYQANVGINRAVKEFLKTLDFGADDLDVFEAVARAKPNTRRDFEKPWAMVLYTQNTQLRHYLIWRQTFAVDKTLAFNIVEFDKDLVSWVIANYCGDAVVDYADARRAALVAVKQKLWVDQAFRRIVDKLMAEKGVPGNINRRVHLATSTFDLSYINTDNAEGHLAPIWQLTGKPLTSDKEKHREYLSIIRNARIFVNFHQLKLDPRIVQCVGCKTATHPGHKCHFPQIEDWKGPKPDTAERFTQSVKRGENSRQETGNRRPPSNRGGRGGKRGGARGGPGGSWSVVTHKRTTKH